MVSQTGNPKLTIITAANAPMNPHDRADRKVDMARHDDHQHPQRHDDHIAVLQEEVGDVHGAHQSAARDDLEEDHDRDQREEQAEIAHMGGHMGLDPLVCVSIFTVPYSLTMSDMMRSWLAFSAVISPTNAPSFMT